MEVELRLEGVRLNLATALSQLGRVVDISSRLLEAQLLLLLLQFTQLKCPSTGNHSMPRLSLISIQKNALTD